MSALAEVSIAQEYAETVSNSIKVELHENYLVIHRPHCGDPFTVKVPRNALEFQRAQMTIAGHLHFCLYDELRKSLRDHFARSLVPHLAARKILVSALKNKR